MSTSPLRTQMPPSSCPAATWSIALSPRPGTGWKAGPLVLSAKSRALPEPWCRMMPAWRPPAPLQMQPTTEPGGDTPGGRNSLEDVGEPPSRAVTTTSLSSPHPLAGSLTLPLADAPALAPPAVAGAPPDAVLDPLDPPHPAATSAMIASQQSRVVTLGQGSRSGGGRQICLFSVMSGLL